VARLRGSDDALSTERAYVARVLPRAVARELRSGRPASAAAVVAALGFTTAGYLRGRLPGAASGVRLPDPVVAALPAGHVERRTPDAEPVAAQPAAAQPTATQRAAAQPTAAQPAGIAARG
jgi:hypothetical protein